MASNIVQSYLTGLGNSPLMAMERAERIAEHPDIERELEYALLHGYMPANINSVSVYGYTAYDIYMKRAFDDTVSIYEMLMMMREDPDGARDYLDDAIRRAREQRMQRL